MSSHVAKQPQKHSPICQNLLNIKTAQTQLDFLIHLKLVDMQDRYQQCVSI